MYLSVHISLKNFTKVFALSLGETVLEPRLIILTRKFTLLEINRRYSVLLGLTDNLFDVIHENTSVTQDSLLRKLTRQVQEKMINKFVYHQHTNNTEYQDDWILQKGVK